MTKLNTKILRNGKVVFSRKRTKEKKRNSKLSFCSTRDFNSLHVKDKTHSNKMIVTPIQICDIQNNNQNKNIGYTNLENLVELNKTQVYKYLKPMVVENKSELITVENTKPVPSTNSLKGKNCLKTNYINNRFNGPITRSEAVKIRAENKKKLEQVMIDKFPKNTFKNVVIHLWDIVEQVKFLKTLGLVYRYKCSFTNCKIKNKT